MPTSLSLSVVFDAKVHFLISDTPLLCSATVTQPSPLCRCLLTTSPWAPSSLQCCSWLRIPTSAHCSSHFTFSLRHLSFNHQLAVTPKSVMTSTSPQDPVHGGTCQPFQGETGPHAVPTETRGATRPLCHEDIS